MKILLSVIFLLLNFVYVQAIEIKIIHNIQNEIITNVDIKNEYKYLLALNNKLQELDNNRILNIANESIIKETIKNIELSKYFKTVEINNDYLNVVLKNIYERQGLKSIEEFEIYLKNYEINLKDFKEKITIDALWNEMIAQKYGKQLVIDKDQINKKITNNTNNQKKEYRLSEIFFEIKNKEEIKIKYAEIINNINEKGFENTASLYSFSESSKIGGDIGWINATSLNNQIKQKFVKLKSGEISKPIIRSSGVLILKITDTRSIAIKTDYKLELEKAINYKKTRQLDQYSNIYYNKIKKNLEFDE